MRLQWWPFARRRPIVAGSVTNSRCNQPQFPSRVSLCYCAPGAAFRAAMGSIVASPRVEPSMYPQARWRMSRYRFLARALVLALPLASCQRRCFPASAAVRPPRRASRRQTPLLLAGSRLRERARSRLREQVQALQEVEAAGWQAGLTGRGQR